MVFSGYIQNARQRWLYIWMRNPQLEDTIKASMGVGIQAITIASLAL
jgi:hypothetical protein